VLSLTKRLSLDHLVVSQIEEAGSRRKIVPFPLVFYRLGCILHFDREFSKLLLKDLEKKRLIRIHDFHGVEILKVRKTLQR
jgi:hypothetical protein